MSTAVTAETMRLARKGERRAVKNEDADDLKIRLLLRLLASIMCDDCDEAPPIVPTH